MANGKPYDPLDMTAAHRRLRFGTVVKVTNLNNGRSVRVVITDRGPFKASDRIIDVSYGAAVRLGMLNQGVVPATVEVVGDIRDPNVVVDERLVEAPQRQSEWLGKAVANFERLVERVLNKN
jgi:rare lipoprotein A